MKQRKISAKIICTIACSTLLASVIAPTSHAQNSEDASYFCTSEMAAGLAYNATLKKWEGVQLSAEGSFSRFILRMKFLKERVQRNIADEEEDVNDYEVSITEAGTNSAFPCRSAGTGVRTKIITVVGDDGNVECSARTYNFTFNLENNRFISVFLYGYVDGIDNNENTPMVSGGTCIKIDQGK
jgi:hypothetical protein